MKASPSEPEAKGAPLAENQSRGFFSDIVLNAIQPGVNYSVLLFLNIVFGLLLLTVLVLAIVTNFNVHLVVFAILTAGLMISLNMWASFALFTKRLCCVANVRSFIGQLLGVQHDQDEQSDGTMAKKTDEKKQD